MQRFVLAVPVERHVPDVSFVDGVVAPFGDGHLGDLGAAGSDEVEQVAGDLAGGDV